MTYQLESSIRDEVVRLFGPDDVAYVVNKLQSTKLIWERSAPPPRVHVAVLWQSNGNLEQFDRSMDDALADWRNTLMWNGLGNEDWRQVLIDAGIECSEW